MLRTKLFSTKPTFCFVNNSLWEVTFHKISLLFAYYFYGNIERHPISTSMKKAGAVCVGLYS